jgi:hypothetical protein
MMAEASPEVARRPPVPALAFVVVAALTAAELAVAAMGGDRAARIAALSCLLLAKVGIVLAWFMGARASRRAARLVVIALVLAAGVAAALMADAAARARLG